MINFAYQKIFGANGVAVGAEILCRLKLGSPVSLFERAERAGREVDLDTVLISRLVGYVPVLLKREKLNYITINLHCLSIQSVHQQNKLRKTLLILNAIMREHGTDLVVEVTESGSVKDYNQFMRSIAWLRSSGIKVFIDDFGTGYCPLLKLMHSDFDGLKLAREVLVAFTALSGPKIDLKSVIQSYSKPGMQIIVEGIETLQEYQVALTLGDQMQGFYFHCPSIFTTDPSLKKTAIQHAPVAAFAY